MLMGSSGRTGNAPDFSGMHTAVLWGGSTVLAAALVRAFGPSLAEVPLIATRPEAQVRAHAGATIAVAYVMVMLAVSGAGHDWPCHGSRYQTAGHAVGMLLVVTAYPAQGNGLGRTLLQAVEAALSHVGVRTAAMPAIITAADEARLPAAPAAGTQPLTPLAGAGPGHQRFEQNGIPDIPTGQSPAGSAAGAGLGSPSSLPAPPALHSFAWGCRVRTSSCKLTC